MSFLYVHFFYITYINIFGFCDQVEWAIFERGLLILKNHNIFSILEFVGMLLKAKSKLLVEIPANFFTKEWRHPPQWFNQMFGFPCLSMGCFISDQKMLRKKSFVFNTKLFSEVKNTQGSINKI